MMDEDRTDRLNLEVTEKRDLRTRLREYSLRILKLYDSLPKTGAVHIITHQLARSGTSPGAQYREACRAKSDADFISKMEGALQELDESDYWLDLLVGGGFLTESRLRPLITETNELISIFVAIITKVKRRRRTSKKEDSSVRPHPSS
ncbi:MAG TPA: four helix bundle protein, partial [Pyrinomonadaceae bacterium]|nr:four helix bundle protein [Pyrinomonadaceae bacterium]